MVALPEEGSKANEPAVRRRRKDAAAPKSSKPTTQRGKRFVEQRAPKLTENPKTALFIKGGQTSTTGSQLLKDLFQLKKPFGVCLNKRNHCYPFEDDTLLDKLSQRYDSSLFAFASHSKKRPHSLIFGRMHDYHVLDMAQFTVENFKSIAEHKTPKCAAATKPCLIFIGENFEEKAEMKRLKNLFLDFFRGQTVDSLRLQGLELVITFTAHENCLFMRTYRIFLKKSGSRVPRIELKEMGPCCDLRLNRTRFSSDDFFKAATKQPAAAKPKRDKNVSRDVFGTQLARVHVGKQDLGRFQTRKMKGLKRLGKGKKKV